MSKMDSYNQARRSGKHTNPESLVGTGKVVQEPVAVVEDTPWYKEPLTLINVVVCIAVLIAAWLYVKKNHPAEVASTIETAEEFVQDARGLLVPQGSGTKAYIAQDAAIMEIQNQVNQEAMVKMVTEKYFELIKTNPNYKLVIDTWVGGKRKRKTVQDLPRN